MLAPQLLTAETMPTKLVIDLFHVPKQLSPRVLGSASDFIITAQCLRNLVRIDTSGQLSGDLASTWSISPDKKLYTFTLKAEERFSNGDLIKSEDVVGSLTHADLRKISIHFDFSKIRSIKGRGNVVEIGLLEPNSNFLYHLTQPEFGVFHKTDRGEARPSLKIASGPYFLVSANEQKIILARNPHSKDLGPRRLEFVALAHKKFKALESGEIDMALLWEDPSKEEMAAFTGSDRFDVMHPHVGFTFWMTLNPHSSNMKENSFRALFQKTLKKKFDSKFSPTTSWSRAYQLFLPDGPGRISSQWTERFWRQSPPDSPHGERTLTALVSGRFQFKAELAQALNEAAREVGAKIEFSEYADQSEFQSLLASKPWDIYLINNDFSSYEVIQNLIVTFNKSKPLVQLPSSDEPLQRLWSEIQTADTAEARYSRIERLAKDLLEKALIVPLAYKNVPIIKRKEVDLSGWSTLFPEFAFWKVRIAGKPRGS